MAGFDINKSKVSEDALSEFLDNEVSEDILTVPGIGPAAKAKLAAELEGDSPIHTTHQLIGKFLTMRAPGITVKEHCEIMWQYLKLRGVDSFRAGIVHAIAEKVNLMIPGTFSISEAQ